MWRTFWISASLNWPQTFFEMDMYESAGWKELWDGQGGEIEAKQFFDIATRHKVMTWGHV